MSSASPMERQVTKSLRLALRGSEPALAAPLVAINWFDTRYAPLYHLYNALAARHVRRIGARPLFKAELRETLAGDACLARRFLLIVRYPCGERFLDLLSSRRFQLLSLLRIMTVRRFSFVLHGQIESPAPLPERLPVRI